MKIRESISLPVLTSAFVVGCASPPKIQRPDQPMNSPQAPAAGHDAAGNTLSQWIDRTSLMRQSTAGPNAAEDCAMIYDPIKHRLVVFGGKNDDDQNLNELWELDLERYRWQKIVVEGECPPPTEDHAVIYDPLSHRMIVHGGENGPTWNHIWALDLKTHRWRNLTDSTAPAREDHTAIFDSQGKRMVVFGGRISDQSDMGDLWTFDLDPNSPAFEKWQRLTTRVKSPAARSDHVAVYDAKKNRMVIYGGWDKEGKEYFGDTWGFTFAVPPDTGKWRQIKTKKSYPPKRRHAVSVYDAARNWLVICGGFGEEGYLNDVWAFDLTRETWINISPGPQPRIDHQAVYDPRSQRLILYGGDARLRTKFHDLWELQIRPDLQPEWLWFVPEALTKAVEKP